MILIIQSLNQLSVMDTSAEDFVLSIAILYCPNGEILDFRNYIFKSYESASKFLLEEEMSNAHTYWYYENENLDEDEREEFLNKEIFNVESLKSYISSCSNDGTPIYSLYSKEENKDVYFIYLTKSKLC